MENNRLYRALQQHLDKSPVGFPATPSDIDIAVLKRFFTSQEAQIALCLSTIKLEPIKTIHRRLQKSRVVISLDELQKKLDVMAHKGTILVYSEGFKEKHYKNAGVTAGGIFDFQVDRLTKEVVDIFHQYHVEAFAQAEMTGSRSIPQLRTIPVGQSIPKPELHNVATHDDIRRLLEDSPGPFAIANCICRQTKDIQGQPCAYSDIRETCLQIGTDHARQCVEMGIARYISKEEAFEVIEKAQAAGFILQPENSKHPEAICCCCADCCMILSTVIKTPHPAEMYATNYFAVVDSALCKACGACVKRCQLGARTIQTTPLPNDLSLEGRGIKGEGEIKSVSVVNLDRCIGCGNCVITCTNGATRLAKKEKALVPPNNKTATYMKIMSDKVGPWKMLKFRLKMLLGMRV